MNSDQTKPSKRPRHCPATPTEQANNVHRPMPNQPSRGKPGQANKCQTVNVVCSLDDCLSFTSQGFKSLMLSVLSIDGPTTDQYVLDPKVRLEGKPDRSRVCVSRGLWHLRLSTL
jgi:hypothetical protein